MSAEITLIGRDPMRWEVTCTEHALFRIVYTDDHATNLAALHNRVDHTEPTPDALEFNVTAAAKAYLNTGDDPAARVVWESLVVGTGEDPRALAERLSGGPATIAYTAPF